MADMSARPGVSPAFEVGAVEVFPLLPLEGVVWRSCRFRSGTTEGLRHGAGGDAIHIALPAELERAVDKRRSEFLAGRLCALLALRAAGAPEVVGRAGRAPVWPAGLRGSISHTAGRAMAVVSRRVTAIGLDCEPPIPAATAAGIARRVLTPGDRAFRPPDWDEARFLTLAFSAKEAVYKALSDRLADIPGFGEAHLASLSAGELVIAFRDWRVRVRYGFHDGDCVTLAWLD